MPRHPYDKSQFRKITYNSDPGVGLEPKLTLEEIVLAGGETPTFDLGIPSIVEYTDRSPDEYVLSGSLGPEAPMKPRGRHFATLDAVAQWAQEKFGSRARLSTRCRVLKGAVEEGRYHMSTWTLWVRKSGGGQ